MKKGLSTIIASLIMVLLVIVMVGVVWGVTKSIVDKNTDMSCFSNYGKVTLNNDYTCYGLDPSDNNKYNIQFSINVGNIDIEGIIVTLIGAQDSESFEIKNKKVDNLKYYGGEDGEKINFPNKNAGLTYNATKLDYKIDAIRIAPIINGKQCEVSDSINEISDCKSSA